MNYKKNKKQLGINGLEGKTRTSEAVKNQKI